MSLRGGSADPGVCGSRGGVTHATGRVSQDIADFSGKKSKDQSPQCFASCHEGMSYGAFSAVVLWELSIG